MLAVVGDCHGHLQLALCVLARWQQELGQAFEAVFLCGDVGTFTADEQLDSTTRRHGKTNPCELEFLTQWSAEPPAPWLSLIFAPENEGGLGLGCPVLMVTGNHEGFAYLQQLVPPGFPAAPVAPEQLPAVDRPGHVRLLPSGWKTVTGSGRVVAGVGGIERGQRRADYHPLAYVADDAVAHLLESGPINVLVTHQGPTEVQGEHGSPTLQLLLDAGLARVWFHGHSTPQPEPALAGPNGSTLVVPLGDVAFPGRGPHADEPGEDGWALLGASAEKVAPPFLREFRRNRWTRTPDGLLIAPPLAQAFRAHSPRALPF